MFFVNSVLCDIYRFSAALEGLYLYNRSISAIESADELYAGSDSLSSATNLQTDWTSGHVSIIKPSSLNFL